MFSTAKCQLPSGMAQWNNNTSHLSVSLFKSPVYVIIISFPDYGDINRIFISSIDYPIFTYINTLIFGISRQLL